MLKRSAFFCFLFAVFSAAWVSAQTHPFSARDLMAMERLSDAQVSPDGRRVVFVVSKPDLEANRNRTDLWLVSTDGSNLRRLTTDPAADVNPRWSPEGGTIWFISTRSGSAQVWRISPEGGEAVQVTHLPLDASNLVVSPRGGHLAFTLFVYPDCPDIECTRTRIKEREEEKPSGVVFDHLFIRHWDVWKEGLRTHLFVTPVVEGTAGTAVNVMQGMDADTPSQPFGGPEEITFTPDGRSVVFAAKREVSREAWTTNFDLFVSPVDGSQAPRNLTGANPAWDTHPLFSPDGKRLAYLSMSRPGYESDRFRIVLMDWPSGRPRTLTEEWDRSPSSLTWSPDGKQIFAVASHIGQSSLFAVDVATAQVRTVVGQGHVASVNAASGRIVFARDDLRSPADLYTAGYDGSNPRRITDLNREPLSQVRMGEFEQFDFEGWNGETVYTYVVKPADFDPGKKYPVAFLIHGGPQGSFGNLFHYRWNPQVYAGAGYAAVMVDFHGSVGYGQAFTDSIRGDWGGKPFVDLQKGLEAALERYPWMEGQRVAALGASYGGYMINWIAGNWPDRFRCLVNHDGVFDMRSMYYSTEELWFPEWEFGGPYAENPEPYERHNPARFVENWKTPMLVIHGALDFRVPLEQGIAAFTALQRRGVPSRFLYFPDENHWVLKPANSLQWHRTVLEWLAQWME